MGPDRTYLVTRGTEYWREGQIALEVHADGAAAVEHRRSGEHRRYEGRLAPGEFERFDALGLPEMRPSRTEYRMDEATVSIEVREGDGIVHQADLPAGDRETDDRLDALLTLMSAVVERVTEGDLPRGPAAAPR